MKTSETVDKLNQLADKIRQLIAEELPDATYFLTTVVPIPEVKGHYHSTLTNIEHGELLKYMTAVVQSIQDGTHPPQRQGHHIGEQGLRPSETPPDEARQIPGVDGET